MDNMPDFDSMTPEEMMAWMEALAKRQGATEGLVTAGDMEVPEIDPSTVGEIDEPGYIPFGMDPEVWAHKKAKEDAERAERIAAMKADKEKTAQQRSVSAPPPTPAAAATSPLDFLANLAGTTDNPDTSPVFPVGEFDQEEPAADALVSFEAAGQDVPMEDLFADLGGAIAAQEPGDMDWLSSLGQGQDLAGLDNLDFGSLEALDQPVAQESGNPLDWLESLVGSGDSASDVQEEVPMAQAAGIDDMIIDDSDDILEDSAVSAVLNDPMEWLADFSDTEPMIEDLQQAAASREVLEVSDDLDSFFDRIQSEDASDLPEIDLDMNRPMGEIVESGMIDFGGTPDFDEISELPAELSVGSALTQGSEVQPEEVKAWMDSLLDRGIQRTDVTDEEEAEMLTPVSELPSWLIEEVGEPPSTDEMLADTGDLPDWLTAPVSDAQSAEFEEMFSHMAEEPQEERETALPEFEVPVAPLDTGVIRVQMNDPWVEAFELERDEKLSDTGKLAAWYESAAHEVEMARQSETEQAAPPVSPVPPVAAVSQAPVVGSATLKAALLPAEEELPVGEPQAIPTWLGGAEAAPPAVTAKPDETQAASAGEEELPDWLRAAQLQSDEMAEVPTWLTDSLSTDEFEVLQVGEKPAVSIQDEPTTPLPVVPAQSVLTVPAPLTQRQTAEVRQMRAARDVVPLHEAAGVINQARANQKMGDLNGMLDSYERLIRSEVALEEVEVDMERVSKDAVHKTNPAVLRVYGDVLLRRGKLQQALDTYRAALNLL